MAENKVQDSSILGTWNYWWLNGGGNIIGFDDKQLTFLQGGPLPVISRVVSYNSIYRGYNPSYPFIRPFVGVITPFITRLGAHIVTSQMVKNS